MAVNRLQEPNGVCLHGVVELDEGGDGLQFKSNVTELIDEWVSVSLDTESKKLDFPNLIEKRFPCW